MRGDRHAVVATTAPAGTGAWQAPWEVGWRSDAVGFEPANQYGGSMFDLGLADSVWPVVWLVVAVVFTLIELTVLGGSLVLLPFGISALLASILGVYGAPVAVQWLVFGVVGAILFAVFARWASLLRTSNPLPPGVGADRLVGVAATVTSPIAAADADRVGRVVVMGETWFAFTQVGDAIPEGATVRILAVEGTRVEVEPLPTGPPTDDRLAPPSQRHPGPPTADRPSGGPSPPDDSPSSTIGPPS